MQDLGRQGYAHLGVPCSGAADAASLRLANRLVGNPERLAGIEITFGMARLRFPAGAWVALAGAPCPVWEVRPGAGMGVPFWVPKGVKYGSGRRRGACGTYLAVAGGVAVEPVLGSRSTDSLSGLGPPPLRPGTVLPVGPAAELDDITADLAPLAGPRPPVLRVLPDHVTTGSPPVPWKPSARPRTP